MEAAQQKSQSKLTRTQSLLRSSPTIRSSIHSLSSIAEDECSSSSPKTVEEKPRRPNRSGSTPRAGSSRFSPVLAMASVVVSSFVLGYFFFFLFYLRTEEIATSENLLLALIFIAIALYFASKNKGLIQHALNSVRQSARRLGFGRTDSKPVLWFIGDSASKTPIRKTGVVKEGVEFYSNGDCYEGEFHKGRCNGSGVYHYFASGRYEGDWVDGRYDGYGIESWARGSRYRGQYRLGMRHGYGVYRFYTGDTYAGEWCNGQSHGVGVQTCSDGSSYVGNFKYGVKHGLGCYHFRNGDRYSGEYFGDRIHGFGVYHFANGHSYEGSWHEGRKQGYGMYTFRSGDTRCGEWDSGNLKTPLPPLSNAVLQAVQAARKAAEEAVRVHRVDEMVNKAILAANRSANAARVAAVKALQNQMDGNFCDLDV